MNKGSRKYQTQWASQFYAAAELTRRGYLTSLTLGSAPITDLLVVSQSGRQFMVDVKGQGTRNFWLIKRRDPQDNLFYILSYIPPRSNEPPRFFILSSKEMMAEREKYKEHIMAKSRRYRDDLGGINWSTAFNYENKWDKLPT